MRANPEVCSQVDEIDDMANWRSVIAWGRYEELKGELAIAAMNLLSPGCPAHTARPPDQPAGAPAAPTTNIRRSATCAF